MSYFGPTNFGLAGAAQFSWWTFIDGSSVVARLMCGTALGAAWDLGAGIDIILPVLGASAALSNLVLVYDLHIHAIRSGLTPTTSGDIYGAGGLTYTFGAGVATAQYQPYFWTMYTIAGGTLSTGDSLQIYFRRQGGHASDTLAQTMGLVQPWLVGTRKQV